MQLLVYAVAFITACITVSNALALALLVSIALDPCAPLQGVDFCIFSLALSDLLAGLLIGPFSLLSFQFNTWMFGDLLCKAIGFAMFALWAVNVNSLFWLSVDRLLYITDYKYCTYKMRTRARCICKIILSWIMSALFSLVPLIVNKNASFLPHSAVCVIDWFTVEAYYLTVTSIIIVPCLAATLFNYARIFFWRIQYGTGFRKLKAANVEYLVEPTHVMALVLTLVFWCSWLPYLVHLIQYKFWGPRTPAFADIWTGFAQSMWKFPVMVAFCPRYRAYAREWCGGRRVGDGEGAAVWRRRQSAWSVISNRQHGVCTDFDVVGADGRRRQDLVYGTTRWTPPVAAAVAVATGGCRDGGRATDEVVADEEIYM